MRTNNKATEERIDPAHDQGLRHNHRHIPLHHAHHALHGGRIGHGVRGRLALGLGVLQEGAALEGGHEVVLARREGRVREHGRVLPEVDPALQTALFAKARQVGFLGRGGDEDGDIVAQDAGQDLRGLAGVGERAGGGGCTMTVMMGKRIQ